MFLYGNGHLAFPRSPYAVSFWTGAEISSLSICPVIPRAVGRRYRVRRPRLAMVNVDHSWSPRSRLFTGLWLMEETVQPYGPARQGNGMLQGTVARHFLYSNGLLRTCPDWNRADLIGIGYYGVAAMAEPKTRLNWRTGCAIIARSTAPTMVSCERPSPNPVTMPAKRQGHSSIATRRRPT